MLYLLLVAAALAPGVATAYRLRHRGWGIAVFAGTAITVCVPLVLMSSLVVFPGLGFLVAVGAALAALAAYDDGRIVAATAWAFTATVAINCAGWSM